MNSPDCASHRVREALTGVLKLMPLTRIFPLAILLAVLPLVPTTSHAQEVRSFTTTRMGVNLSGGEFGSKLPGTFDQDYTYPTAKSLDYYVATGRTLVRLPFKWERVQHAPGAPLDADEVARLHAVLHAAGERHMSVILDAHNYGRYQFAGEDKSEIIGAGRVSPADFADFWGRMAREFKDETALYGYGLMNEPHDMGDPERWPRAAQAAIDAIRAADEITPILVAGDGWSSSLNWGKSDNAQLNEKLRDPQNNLVFEAHCYFDKDRSGQYKSSYEAELGTPDVGVENVRPFVEWCKAKGVRGFVGEFGVPNNDARWLVTLTNFLSYLQRNQMSATYWSGGPWWGKYPLSIEPTTGEDDAKIDRPQMQVLRDYPG